MDSSGSDTSKSSIASQVQGRTTDGRVFNGWITHFRTESIVFEICSPQQVLRSTEVLPEFRASINGVTVYSGRAVIRGFLDEGISQRCEVTLDSEWDRISNRERLFNSEDFAEECRGFLKHWDQCCRVSSEFKLLIADMRLFLEEFRLWLNKIEVQLASIPESERSRNERTLVAKLATSFVPSFNNLFEKFELIAVAINVEQVPAHQDYVKRQLHPLLMCSPFAWRTFTKPLGYAGDYEMVNMIIGDAMAGETLFAKVLNAWFVSQPPAEAHRNRIVLLTQMLEREALRVSHDGAKLKVLNLGCGPAIEIQRFVERSPNCSKVDFTLLDFNDETLNYTRRVIEECRQRYRRQVNVTFVKKSVVQLLKAGGRGGLGENFDLIYCAGLYDYLPDQLCRQLNAIYYSLLAPGGLLVTTNVDASNPIRHMLDYVLEWHLIYRDAGQFSALAPAAALSESVRLYSDFTGVNIFMEVRRPD